MPSYPSDNLYSADDDAVSDTQSLSEELSPSDGYFQRPVMSGSPQHLVIDPTVDYGKPEAKTLIEPPNATNNGSRIHPSSPPRHLPSMSSSHVSRLSTSPAQASSVPVSPVASRLRHASFSEQEPLMYQPPPAYSESPPSSIHSTRHPVPSYHTFSRPQGVPFTPQEPQSMGGPNDEPPSEDTPLMELRKRYTPRRRRIRGLLLIGLVFAVIGTTIGIIVGCPSHPDEQMSPDDDAEYCSHAALLKEQMTYEFLSGNDLSIVHKANNVSSVADTLANVQGEIRLRRSPSPSPHGSKPYITVDILNTPGFDSSIAWSQDSQRLELTTTPSGDARNRERQCLTAIITALIPDDTVIRNLLLESLSLNLALSDINLNVTGRMQFITHSGSAWFTTGPPMEPEPALDRFHPALSSKPIGKINNTTEIVNNFHSRRTIIETHSGSISGSYPLYDALTLSSASGNVDVSVAPKHALEADPKPADLEIQTASGFINVLLPTDDLQEDIPLRDYITRVHTTSGSIDGRYYLGSESSFKTTSGSISITALPVLPDTMAMLQIPPNSFETHTLSGSTKVTALDPFSFGQNSTEFDLDIFAAKLRSLRSSHSSNSGDIRVMHTNTWEGSVHAKSVSGGLEVRGNGFRTIKERHGVAYREVLKRRGVDEKGEGSELEASTVSGSISVNIVA